MPYRLFTDPPLAHAGLSEWRARRQGVAIRVARISVVATTLRTHVTEETEGFMTVPVGANDRIIGFTMIGAKAAG